MQPTVVAADPDGCSIAFSSISCPVVLDEIVLIPLMPHVYTQMYPRLLMNVLFASHCHWLCGVRAGTLTEAS